MGTELNAIELSPKAEVPTCVFGFLEIFEVVPGAGVGEGKGNRRGTQRNAEERRCEILSAISEIFGVTKKPCKRQGLGASGGRALLNLHRKERKELKDSGSSRERAAPRVGESARPKKRPIAPVTEENVEKEP